MILGNKFIVSILVAFVLADSNHKLLPAIITLLLITIGLKITKKITMIEAYAEYGAIGIIVLLFVGMIQFLRSTLMRKLQEIEDISIKLIDRWNRSDETRDRRHEDLIKELNDVTDDINFLKGRINGRD